MRPAALHESTCREILEIIRCQRSWHKTITTLGLLSKFYLSSILILLLQERVQLKQAKCLKCLIQSINGIQYLQLGTQFCHCWCHRWHHGEGDHQWCSPQTELCQESPWWYLRSKGQDHFVPLSKNQQNSFMPSYNMFQAFWHRVSHGVEQPCFLELGYYQPPLDSTLSL